MVFALYKQVLGRWTVDKGTVSMLYRSRSLFVSIPAIRVDMYI